MNDACVCIGCGCDDLNPCPGGCAWLRQDKVVQLGVCSACPSHVTRFDAGDLEPTEEAMQAFANREAEWIEERHADAPHILVPGDFGYDETLRNMRGRR